MGRFQLESIYLYFPPSSQLLYFTTAGTTVENKGKLILTALLKTRNQRHRQKKLQHPTRPVEKCRVNDERPTGKKTQLVSGTTVEK